MAITTSPGVSKYKHFAIRRWHLYLGGFVFQWGVEPLGYYRPDLRRDCIALFIPQLYKREGVKLKGITFINRIRKVQHG